MTAEADGGPPRLRVVTLLDHLDRGGAERIAVAVASHLDRARFESIVCLTRESASARERLEAAGLRTLFLERTSRLQVWRWWRLLRFLRRERVDVVHAHLFGSNVWGTLIGRLARVPVVIATEHTWSFEGRPVRRFLDRELIGRFSSAFVAVSEQDRARMARIERVPAHKLRVIGTALLPREDRDPAADRIDVRRELGIDEGTPVVGTVGRLVPQKRVDVLIRALAVVREAVPGALLLVVGEGPEREALQGLVARAGLGDAVRFLGQREDVERVLPAMDVFALTSDFEGRPLALIEALDVGVTVVATAVGDVPVMAGDPPCIVLVPAGDQHEVAAAISDLLTRPAECTRLSRLGQTRVRDEFSFPSVVRAWEDLYEELRRMDSRPARS